MEETKREKVTSTEPQRIDVQSLVKQAVEELPVHNRQRPSRLTEQSCRKNVNAENS